MIQLFELRKKLGDLAYCGDVKQLPPAFLNEYLPNWSNSVSNIPIFGTVGFHGDN